MFPLNLRFRFTNVFLFMFLLFLCTSMHAFSYYDMGNPSVVGIYVSPSGSAIGDGAVRSSPVTLGRAWEIVRSDPSRGWSIEMLPGTYTSVPSFFDLPGYVSYTYWTAPGPSSNHPIIFKSADGPGTVTVQGSSFNIAGVNYIYLINFTIVHDQTDLIHYAYGNHLLLKGMNLQGSYSSSHENLKVNQAQYVYVEDSEIVGAEQNPIDFVAVQYFQIVNNRIHRGQDWCVYTKGGSAYGLVEANEIYDCGTGGYSAGEGTGFEYMVSPWLHYEAYGIRAINNVIHDTAGAGLGVNGGYDVLLAHNTLYRVGSRSHVIEVVFGSRSCDGDSDYPNRCTSNQAAGGWGPRNGAAAQNIPARSVYIYNNIVYNPSGFQSQWQHFQFANPSVPASGTNIPNPTTVDGNLQIKGNVIWNGPSSMPIGIEDSQVCTNSNPTCNSAQLLSQNAINTIQPQLVDPAHGNFAPVSGGNLASVQTFTIPNFVWDISTSPAVPSGVLSNLVSSDYLKQSRGSYVFVGAVSLATSTNTSTNVTTPPPPICSLSCTSPQLLNSTSCSCYTPVVTPPTCSLTCTAPALLNSTS
ncbi:right-handed parallel beta-helix repeat-containing protein, partial [Candidatus Micrarchaeota archaeon]|nr:right-handed parallel beta-helix repeat-containing protein [Candidatus Micrarchaeota archaeon]